MPRNGATAAVAPAPDSPGAGHDTKKNTQGEGISMRSLSQRLWLVAMTLWCAGVSHAQDDGTPTATPVAQVATGTVTPQLATPRSKALELPEVVVESRRDNMLGIAQSATQGTTGGQQLGDRPILRSGEILETIPGVIITQHAGGGKANQYFLRGFNLDHGTDFAVFLDRMPLNLPSHAHGEGYADMNVVIPELVERVDYQKGPYYADVGNYGSAGSAHLVFYKALPQNFATVEGGMYGYWRGVFGISQPLGAGTLLQGGEVYHENGPWVHPDNYYKFNGLMTYTLGDDANGFSATGRAYYGKWNSSDQIATSAVPLVGFFGTLNQSTGGRSQRYSLQGEWHRYDGDSETQIMAYGFYYTLDLFSDFTYFLTDTTKGDQFEQPDNRWVGGLDARHTIFGDWSGRSVATTFGIQARNDWINNGLYQTQTRDRTDKCDTNNVDPSLGLGPCVSMGVLGVILPATTQWDKFTDTQFGFWVENRIEWGPFFRSVAGFRGDLQYGDVTALNNPANSGTSTSFLPSPKLSLIFGPWQQSELYLQGGFGFHSNDVRGTTLHVQPISAANPYPNTPASPIPGLIQTTGGEVGVRTLIIPNLQSTISGWYLHSNSELQQEGDTGGTVPSQSSSRWGVEWSNYYTPLEHLSFDLDVASSIARFSQIDPDDAAQSCNNSGCVPLSPGGKDVPEAVGTVIAGGTTLHDWNNFSASLRLRYFGPRNLTSDGIFRSSNTVLLNGEIAYHLSDTWRIGVQLLNILNRRDHDIDYAYASRITPTAIQTFEDVFHPVEPIQVRAGLMARF
jgi:hypothetical protein